MCSTVANSFDFYLHAQGSKSILDHFDAIIFHSPYGKLVRKAFTWLLLNDVQLDEKSYENSDLIKYR